MSERFNKYHSTMPSMRYVFRSGKVAHFTSNTFYTCVELEIKELDDEIAAGNPFLYVDKEELSVAAEDRDPMSKLRKKIIAEYEAEKLKSETPRDMGDSVSAGKGISTSATIAPVAAGSIAVASTKK